jgi:hypothetical protein
MIFAVSASRWKQQGRHEEAFKVFDRLCSSQARRADALANLNRPADALASYERALKLRSRTTLTGAPVCSS